MLSFSADVADYNGLKAAIDKSVEAHNGKLDVLICCAGFCHPGRVGEVSTCSNVTRNRFSHNFTD